MTARVTSLGAALSWLCLSTALWATGTVQGRVTTEDGTPLPGALVIAHSVASGQEHDTLTDQEGAYAIEGLADGLYRLDASAPGFNAYRHDLRISGGDAVEDFVLAIGTLEDEITVTAARGERTLEEIPQAVTVISASELEERRPRSVQEALDRVPNMFAFEANPVRARPTYRGYRSSRLLLLLDGERMNNPRIDANFGGLSPGMIDVTQIASIEVVGGAGSSLYGSDAHGGTINLITKQPERKDGRHLGVALEAMYADNGDFDREYAQLDYGDERWGLRAAISQFSQGFYKSGDTAITLAEVLAVGELSNQIAGNANTYTVWDFPAGGEVPNSQSDGVNGRFDLWFYPGDPGATMQQTLRATYLTSDHDDLGIAFREPPFANTQQGTPKREFDRLSLRYEAVDVSERLSRVALKLHEQTFFEPIRDLTFNIDPGSSAVLGENGFEFTGNASTFTTGGTDSLSNAKITSRAADLQINLVPWDGAIFITGIQLSEEKSPAAGSFSRSAFDGTGTVLSTIVGATVPDSIYENRGIYAQLEWRASDWLRLTGGLRYDEWDSESLPTPGHPLPGGSELGFVGVAVQQLPEQLAAFGITLDGVGDYVDAVAAGESFSTSNDVVTGNVGLTLTLPGGFHPYLRWGDSYREPEITTRYLMRNFGSAFFGAQSLPNPFLDPEEGESLDAGVKWDGGNYRASLGWFESRIDNYIATIVSPVLFFNPDPAHGVLTPLGLFFQSVNVNEVEFDGWELYFEGSFRAGKGSLSPYVSLGWMEGRNLNPTPAEIEIINTFYNRDDTALQLEGSPDNVPFGIVVPFQGTFALRYTSGNGRWFAEYEWRFSDQVRRVEPASVATGNITQFGILKSLDAYDRHALRSGYSFESSPLRLTFAVENLTDELYFVPYTPAPAPGRSFVVGFNYRWGRDL